MNKKEMLVVIVLSFILIIIGMLLFKKNKEEMPPKKDDNKNEVVELANNFNTNIIRSTYKDGNYLISPYSIFIALNMLRDGASSNTKIELDKLLGNGKISDLRNNKLHIANALFIKNKYQNLVLNDYTILLKKNYSAEVLYDEFNTPKVINDWVSKNTNNMIPKILDSIDNNFVMGLANAIYLDIDWQNKFECEKTKRGEFTRGDGSKIDVSMMHNEYRTNDYRYIKEDNIEGVIIPYETINNTSVEFIALMPKDIKDYVTNFDMNIFNKMYTNAIGATELSRINLVLPRFSYEDEIDDLIKVLKSLGIKDAFDSENADFSKIIKKGDISGNLYVDEAIHKTKIELNENGTKAAAVTYFGMKNTALLEEDYQTINITFDKPFVYMIREKNSGEVLFFGMVMNPSKWSGNTCESY